MFDFVCECGVISYICALAVIKIRQNSMNRNKKIILISVLLFGLIAPFIPSLTVLEMFFLLIPFAIVFAVTLIYLIVSLLNKQINSRKALFAFSILPTFLLAQLLAVFSVDKIQRFRSNKIITDLEKIKNETGSFPEQYELTVGIKYTRLKNEEHFKLEYSRGFMVTEKYYSDIGNWKSYGWND
jgi:predicted PurR-regulated permease PerM